LAGCDCCGRDLDGAVLRVLEQIVALPDALGALGSVLLVLAII
jgi:hypothetical protein